MALTMGSHSMTNHWSDRYNGNSVQNRLKLMYLMVCLRPYHRLISTKLRFALFLLLLAFIVVYSVKLLQTSANNNNISISHHFDDTLDDLKHELQYAVMVDAGSSGSRVHIYVWPPHSGDTRQLLQIRMLHNPLGKDVYTAINPGLSSCASKPSSASEYISPLLTFAANNIPKEKHKTTPLFILATAGMRLLPEETQKAILNDLITDIPKNYSFLFPANHAQVITGKEEGIYSWIAINYLMGRFDHTIETGPISQIDINKNHLKRAQTIGMLEMGGASVQIAFEITSDSQYESLQSKHSKEEINDLMSEFNLGCDEHDFEHNYRLYVTTYLGLGANVVRNTYINALISSTINTHDHIDNTTLATKEIQLFDPCLSLDSIEYYNISRRSRNVNGSTLYVHILKGSGDFNECTHRLKHILDPSSESLRQCSSSFNTSCPLRHLSQTNAPFDNSEFYGFSEFWYTMEDLLRQGGVYQFSKFRDSAALYCSTSWSVTMDRFNRKLYPLADNNRLFNQCFKSAWVSSILHDGFKMPKNFAKFKSASTVNQQQVQWTLGALIYRTRFFPLRTIEKQYSGINYSNSYTITSFNFNYALFILCMCVVVFCIVIYLRHLHKMVNNSSIYSNNKLDLKHSNGDSNNRSDLVMIEIPSDREPLIDSLAFR
ncbi:ectonucleoside triphosphate diphosphohydrolase 4-like [Oppia nitens]|uniref:ectonucleoside triphosphate diphosphohydrolase 4-like n=1 Tax=Oppia nitens TaxID=1686743 RepID=UPI0023DA6013|nr:ectonucleoside triphosphate diphosphohydrolase 4-like [Oppia nitens]